jgi:hypothetical protein
MHATQAIGKDRRINADGVARAYSSKYKSYVDIVA